MLEQCSKKQKPQPMEHQTTEQNLQSGEPTAEIASAAIVVFKDGQLSLNKRKYCLKIGVTFKSKNTDEAEPESIHELFPQKKEQSAINVTISLLMMPQELREQFPTISDLYTFLVLSGGSQDKVLIAKEGMKLRKEEGKEVFLDFQEFQDLQAARSSINIDLQNIEDKLLQFSREQWKILELTADHYLNGKELPQENVERQNNGSSLNQNEHPEEKVNMQIITKYAHYISNLDQDDFLQEECQVQEENLPENLLNTIQEEEKSIKDFEEQFEDILKKYRHLNQTHGSGNHSTKSAPKVAPKSSNPFPPGYTPPQLVGQTSSEKGIDDPKLIALNSKKEKLRVGKKMLKMGYTLEEVIQHIEKMEREQKSGKETAFVAPAQGPIRPFHIPRVKQVELPRQPSPKPESQSNDREVRQMLIQLLKEKRYKKLQEVKNHMEREGLVTTMETLKGMVDQIRAKNAQRKKQKQSE